MNKATFSVTTSEGVVISLDVKDLVDGHPTEFGNHVVIRQGGRIEVFGNDRRFPVPRGYRLVDAFIGLVDTDPAKSRMALPQGRVEAVLGDGRVLAVGDVVPPGIQVVQVETPQTSGVSNWAGPCLVFERVAVIAAEPQRTSPTHKK